MHLIANLSMARSGSVDLSLGGGDKPRFLFCAGVSRLSAANAVIPRSAGRAAALFLWEFPSG